MVETSYGSGVYTGEYDEKTKKMNGFGIFIDAKGVIYEGFFKQNKQHGTNRVIRKYNEYNITSYKDDMRHGQSRRI